MEGLLVLLRRLCYPNRWYDLVPLFGRIEPELSVILTWYKIVNLLIYCYYCRFWMMFMSALRIVF